MSHLKLVTGGSSLYAIGLVAEFQLSGNDVSIQEPQRFISWITCRQCYNNATHGQWQSASSKIPDQMPNISQNLCFIQVHNTFSP